MQQSALEKVRVQWLLSALDLSICAMTTSTTPPKRKIFLSYRRADHPDFVERIRDWFAWRYGRDSVFMDFDTIPPFTRFADFIREKVAECDVLVAVIGPGWLDTLKARQNEEEADYVRIEIRLALEEGKPIAPICIKGAHAPRRRDLPPDLQAMMDYHVASLDSGRHFLDNIERIIEGTEELLARIDMFQSVKQDIQAYQRPEFDIQGAILSFQEAADKADWYTARDWLSRIRHSGFMPRFYPIDDYEREVREAIDHLEAERDYGVIRAMAERAAKGREDKSRVWSALQNFWDSHPGYDPDDLATQVKSHMIPVQGVANLSFTGQAELSVKKSLDSINFDHIDSLNPEVLDVLFNPDTLETLAQQNAVHGETLTLEEAEALGLFPKD